ncbi:universal stress protein [Deinococcus ficus]|uniref:UspA domain-containing protein n=1 Tax=Deinococcus ficus TaxID=317577 RepID=A0A221T154_9DEIO|nr:universal stress protein [Deinococcus ficus]ASN82624.1 hypothetical protein DFI_15760 [Deinococcus ficus]
MRRILIPIRDLDTDQYALELAWQRFGSAELHLLHLLPTLTHRVITSPEVALADFALTQQELGAEEAARLDGRAALAAIGHQGGYEVVTTPDPAAEILRRAPAFDLVLIGTRALRGLDRLLLGSVAHRVALDSPVPVMTVRTAPTPSRDGGRAPSRRLLLIRDASDTGTAAERYVRDTFPEAAVDVTTLSPEPGPMVFALHNPAAVALLHERQMAWRRAQQREWASGGHPVQGNPAVVALEALQHGEYDLLVLGTQARSALERFFQGSVAGQVIRDADIPVLTVRRVLSSQEDSARDWSSRGEHPSLPTFTR